MQNEDLRNKADIKGSPQKSLMAATFGFFVGFAAVALYGPAAKNFKDIMGLSGLLLGLLVAAPQLTGSLLRIPFGAWVDKAGGKKPFLILLCLSVIGKAGLTLLLFLYYPDRLSIDFYPLILFLGFLSGCGVATFSVGIPQTSYWFPQNKQGGALGTYAGLGNTAPGFFTILLPIALTALGLTKAYAAWFIFLIIGTIVYSAIAQDAYYFQLTKKGISREEAIKISKQMGQELIPSGKIKEALRISAKTNRTWALVFLYFTSFGGFLSLTTWFPAYWSLYQGVSIRVAGLLTAIFFTLLASFVRVYGGHISDKLGGEKSGIASFLLVASGATVLIFAKGFVPSLVGQIIIGAGMGSANASVFKLIAKYVPEAVGGASGWVGGLGAFGGFVVPPLLGIFVDNLGREGYARGFVIYLILAMFSILISYHLKKSFHRD